MMTLVDTHKISEDNKRISAENKYKNLIPVTITSIDGSLFHEDDFSKVTLYSGEVLTIKGTIPVPDTVFSMPLSKNGNVEAMFPVSVVNGEFSAKVIFDTTGQYVYSETEANLDLKEKMFKVKTIKIDVLRKVL